MIKWLFILAFGAFILIYVLGYEVEIGSWKIGKQRQDTPTTLIQQGVEAKGRELGITSTQNPNLNKCDTATSGLMFSTIKNECIDPKKIGTELTSIDDQKVAYMLMSDDEKSVEIFYITSEPILLHYFGIKEAYVSGKYTLTKTILKTELFYDNKLAYQAR